MAINHVLQDLPFRKEGFNVHYGNPTEGFAIDFCLVMDDRTPDGWSEAANSKETPQKGNEVSP